MGALTAILLLVFKDAILGLVAGIQLVSNDMVRPGDWIEMPKYGADGDVVEVSLTTVKVRNWDKTITTVPTYALISDSFKNWRGMSESGGRRIKRSISIDVDSIRHCDDAMLDRYERIERIADYVRETRARLAKSNREAGSDDAVPVNGRRMTNVGTFRKYVEAYLRELPDVHPEMTFLVRQLQPTDRGLPIEIYVFSKDQRWERYEEIQADIFDHLYASLPFFGLRAFQLPSGASLAALAAPRAGGG
jgi:miniconductance mechanosensitive channel